MGKVGSADVGRRHEDDLPLGSRSHSRAGAVCAALAGLTGAWFAAGSTGLLGYALQRGLTWAALGVAVLLGWRMGPGRWTRLILLVAALATAVVMIASDAAVLHVFAVALVLLAVSLGRAEGKEGDRQGDSPSLCRPILLAAEAAAVLGLYRLAYTSIGWFWLLCDRSGGALGSVAGWITGQPLWVGATFAGLDFLVVMLYLAIRGPIASAGRGIATGRLALRIGLGIGAVLIGQLAYLSLLACGSAISERLLEPTPVGDRPVPGEGTLAGQAAF